MILCIDIGNTNLHLAIFSDKKIISRSKEKTVLFQTLAFSDNFFKPLSEFQISKIGISSVVPNVMPSVFSSLKLLFPSVEIVLISTTIQLPFKIRYQTPQTLGQDRIAITARAVELFQKSAVIAIDFGTAITYDIITSKRDLLGGIILAGVGLNASSLGERTSQLYSPDFHKTSKLIGDSTKSCLESGLYWGLVSQTESLIEKFKSELKKKYKEKKISVLATGGDGKIISRAVSAIDQYDDFAVLHGIRKITELN